MLSTEKIFVKSNCVKKDALDAGFQPYDYVKSLVRNTEYSNALNKKEWKNGVKALENAYPNIDVFTCEEEKIKTALGNDAGDFIKRREEINALKKECDSLLPLEKITSLCTADRVHIILMAHAIYKNVQLDVDIFDTEKGGIDISGAIKKYYASGTMKELKDALRPVFHKLLGSEGDYFYAVKTKKSDFSDKDLRNFFATFGGSAKRDSKKVKVDGKETINFSDFNYTDKSGNKKVQISAFTTLCAVVLDNASKHDVVKPEESEK